MQIEAMALWKYQAQNADELSLTPDEILKVHGPAPDADWYTCKLLLASATMYSAVCVDLSCGELSS